jgi:hypothetical protein
MSSSDSFRPSRTTSESSGPPPDTSTEASQVVEVSVPDSIDQETEAEDEEEVMEVPEPSPDILHLRKVEVCQEMIMDMLNVVRLGLMTSDPKYAKNWCKQLLKMIANLIWTHADDESKDVVTAKIFEAWNTSAAAHDHAATIMDRECRYHAEVARALHQNGWEAEAVKEDRKATRRASRVARANRYAEIWRQMIETMRKKG